MGAGYAMGEWTFAERFQVIGGARVERWSLDLDAVPTSDGVRHVERRQTDVLPSLALNVRLGDAQNLRLSASRTVASGRSSATRSCSARGCRTSTHAGSCTPARARC